MIATAALFLLAGCGEAVAPDAGTFDAGSDAGVAAELPWLRDDLGRVVILRGTNVSGDSKEPPDFMANDYVTQADYARLADEIGMNAIRFLIFWEAIEPEPGVYDDVYLAEVRRRIEEAAAAGLLVVVDMHQDVFGRGFGSDGAPRWACDEALYASFEMNRPAEWYLGYARPEVQECFDRLYLDPALRASFAAAWAHAVSVLRGANGIFAYEILNEPHWGMTGIREFEQVVLPAFYAEVIDAIRAEDPSMPYIFMEPSSTTNVGLSTAFIPPEGERLVFAPHVYPAGLEQGTGWDETQQFLDDWMAELRHDALHMGLPLVVTEVGARPDIVGAELYLRDVYDSFDTFSFSALQWDAGHTGGYGLYVDGMPSPNAIAIARPHPSRIAGEPVEFFWDGGRFVLEWIEDGSAEGETEVTVPSLTFPRGVAAFIADGGEVRVEGNMVRVPQIGGTRILTLRAL